MSLLSSTILSRRPLWRRDAAGNIAMLTALAIVPLVLIIGMAVDYRRSAYNKLASQDAIDAAVLAGGRVYASHPGPTETDKLNAAKAAAQILFDADMRKFGVYNPAIDPNFFKNASDEFVGTYRVDTDLIFGGLFGRDFLVANVEAASTVGSARGLEIALVLDNSSSMFNGTRMEDVRAAAKGFVEDVYSVAKAPEDVRIAVVPFAGTLNIKSEVPGTWVSGVSDTVTITPDPSASGTQSLPAAPMANRNTYVGDPYTNPLASVTNSDLLNLFAPTDWRGCIWSAPGERRTVAPGAVPTADRLTDAPPSPMRWPAGLTAAEYGSVTIVSPPPPPPPPPPSPPPPPPPPP
ncbi:MAG: pilus assembly protein, partial [Pseudomonadota bacterium]